ncbi:MetQ/NlpA family ABC transporter substrate-binding protein [Caulobacter endophyticus]|uniref:MetQ/NlpA family ABC transporter substrate-binding protein n=1 Tax=Caulobacter endophyticus TaxID=2172652 RepID=UPI00240FC0C8|nr:MetQ/NlpA family ABC transporter substrate-binding protein [Caulobacter endophyticus]MDG2527569.1 MetQ/NlpA family ABC transporter substrate-binding protein [Caulobacter endophyticus]
MVARRAALVSLAAFALLAACNRQPAPSAADTLVVGATAVPHAEVLEFIKPKLAAEGLKIDIKVFNDYVQPNVQLAERHLDANYFQTGPYLDTVNADRGWGLVKAAGVHIEPLGAYSAKIKAIGELPAGATVAIPNEPSNGGRALLLLNKNGLITLKDPTNPVSTLKDITANPKNLKFKELESATLPRVLNQVDLAVINTNYALDAKLDPAKDALLIEDKTSPYVNFLVTRPDNASDPRVAKLAKTLTSPEVKAFMAEKYKGAVVPAF